MAAETEKEKIAKANAGLEFKWAKLDLLTEKLFQYNADVDIKAFLKDLKNTLIKKSFTDMNQIFVPLKDGEFKENNEFTRNEDYFETMYVVVKRPKSSELEIKWEAIRKKLPFTSYGYVEFVMLLQIRNWKKKEVLVGNSKKTYDSGGWEFRNAFVYKNDVISEYLDKIPIVKFSKHLKQMYLNSIYYAKAEKEIYDFVIPELFNAIQGVIEKHFVVNSGK